MTPREYIKQRTGFEINFDNESDEPEFTWTIIEDLMVEYANYISDFKNLNEETETKPPRIPCEYPDCNCLVTCAWYERNEA